jgi:hypothetical protein
VVVVVEVVVVVAVISASILSCSIAVVFGYTEMNTSS